MTLPGIRLWIERKKWETVTILILIHQFSFIAFLKYHNQAFSRISESLNKTSKSYKFIILNFYFPFISCCHRNAFCVGRWRNKVQFSFCLMFHKLHFLFYFRDLSTRPKRHWQDGIFYLLLFANFSPIALSF